MRAKNYFHADGFPLAVDRRVFDKPFDLHGHDFSQIVLVTGGRAMHRIGRDAWPLSAGVAFVVKGRDAHEYSNPDGLTVVYVHYRPEHLTWDLADLATLPGYHALFTIDPKWRPRDQFKSRLQLTPAELGHALGLVDQLEAELATRGAGFRFLGTALFMQLVAYLSRLYDRAGHPDSQALSRLAAAISHLETHFIEPVELDDLARIAHMSTRSFLRTFHAATGQSPIAYLIQTRVTRAAERLRKTDDSITDVAYACGFEDSNYFSRQFRRVMGLTPRDYRAANRG
jgi:AraC-like DNA-binding protein